jgi:hypothetical protein
MAISIQNNRIRWVVGILSISLLVLSGCKRTSTDTATGKREPPDFTQPVRVSSGDVDAAEPAIAESPDGSMYVAWVNHGPKSQADVMIARFTGDGKMQGSAVRVNPQPGTATAWRGDPPTVAVAPDQTVLVGWTARVEAEAGHATDIWLSSSRDHGQTFSAPVKVYDDAKSAVHGMHSLAIGADAHIYVAWLDERNIVPMQDMKLDAKTAGHHMESNRELFFASSSDHGRTFSANQRVATDVCPCCKTALAINADGRLYVSWRQVLPGDLRHIAVSSPPDQGKTFTSPVIVSDDQWVLAGCPVSGSTLSVGQNGTLGVLWYSAGKNGETGLYWSQSKDNGATFGARRLVSAGLTHGTPVLLVTNGDFTGVWQGNESGKAKVLTARLDAPRTASDSFIVASDGELPAAAATKLGVVIAYIAKGDQHQGIWVTYEPSS